LALIIGVSVSENDGGDENGNRERDGEFAEEAANDVTHETKAE